jgi:transcriptional regulator
MHINSAFRIDNPDTLLKIMQENAFATLITTDEKGRPVATQLPFLIKQKNNKIVLMAHFAKANPQWKHLESNAQVLVSFQGPHCYVSPSWYEKQGVPTWDYVAVQAYGSAKIFDSANLTRELIEDLTDEYENDQENPWKPKDNYPDKMLKAIVGFEISVQEIEGKVKIGQNKSGEDLEGVVKALEKSSSEQELAIANLIKSHLKSKD